jgi:broad specificity phosphatase PhoE
VKASAPSPQPSVLSPQPSALGPSLTRVTLVRHGETEGESSVRYHGVNDVALSQVGREQMERVGRALAGEVFDAVYVSRLRRTLESARVIAPAHAPRCLAGFDEVNFGRWEGLTREEIEALDPHLFRRWRESLGDFTYPDGDRVSDFRARVAATWRELESTAPPRVLVVAHRGVISIIVAEALRLPPEDLRRWRIELGSIHLLVRAGSSSPWRAELADGHEHLEG